MTDSLHVVCPDCGAVNRVPSQRLGESPNCGKCSTRLTGGGPVNLDEAGFVRHLEKSDLPLVVDFWAPWCGPCKSMAPAFAEAAAVLGPEVRLAKVNTDAEQAIAARYGIQSIPTMILFEGGQEKARTSGAMPADTIANWVKSQL